MTQAQPNPYASAPAAPKTGQARIALILAGVVVLLSIVANVVTQLLPMIVNNLGLSYAGASFILLPFQVVQLVLAVTAIILAVPALTGAGPKGIAGIAVGASAAWIITAAFNLVSSLLLSLVY
ncbi:MAG TPA: hypothetical protein VN200_02690 [Rhodoglobus sp.]|nr:hypothetical protein [Rhodoglobus sp.]